MAIIVDDGGGENRTLVLQSLKKAASTCIVSRSLYTGAIPVRDTADRQPPTYEYILPLPARNALPEEMYQEYERQNLEDPWSNLPFAGYSNLLGLGYRHC